MHIRSRKIMLYIRNNNYIVHRKKNKKKHAAIIKLNGFYFFKTRTG